MKDSPITRLLNDSVDSELATGTETILVVDDERLLRKAVCRLLKKAGYEVIDVEDATAAIEIIKSNDHIDLLFTDIIMPGDTDGRELAHWVFQNRPSIKVLLTSGYYEVSDGNVEVNNDDIPLLRKPYKKSKLLLDVRTVLDS